MTKLYELSNDLESIQSDEVDEQTMIDTIEGLEGEFNDKAVSVIKFIENMNGDLSVIDNAIDKLKSRKKSIENKRSSIREYLLFNMEKTGITKIECPLFTASIRKGSESVVIDNISSIPDEYVKVQVTENVNKQKIKSDIKSGLKINGARIERSPNTLTIK